MQICPVLCTDWNQPASQQQRAIWPHRDSGAPTVSAAQCGWRAIVFLLFCRSLVLPVPTYLLQTTISITILQSLPNMNGGNKQMKRDCNGMNPVNLKCNLSDFCATFGNFTILATFTILAYFGKFRSRWKKICHGDSGVLWPQNYVAVGDNRLCNGETDQKCIIP